MFNRISVIGIVLVMVFGNVNCSHHAHQPERILPTLQVIYSGPANQTGWYKTMTIKNDGLVTIVEQPPTEQEHQNQIIKAESLLKSDIHALKILVDEMDIFRFQDSYRCQQNCSEPIPHHTLQFTVNDQRKNISFAHAQEIPPSLQQIWTAINQIEQQVAH